MTDWLDGPRTWANVIVDASAEGPAHDIVVQPLLPAEWGGQGSMVSYLAGCHVVLARLSDEERHLSAALDYLRLPVITHSFATNALWRAITGLRNADVLAEDDSEAIRTAAMATVEQNTRHIENRIGRRLFNHAVCAANLCDAVARLWPDAADSPRLLSLADEVWEDWWRLGENMEIAANYEAFAQCALLAWSERRGDLRFAMDHPATRGWIRRSLEHFLPLGIVPGYGDTCTMELWADWFELYAMIVAAADGTSAEQSLFGEQALFDARRMFEWAEKRDWIRNTAIVDTVPDDQYRARQAWGQVPRTGWSLARGAEILRACAGRVTPRPIPARPVVSHRSTLAESPLPGDSPSLLQPGLGPRIPDKVVLRLGADEGSPSAMLGCSRQLWHDHLDCGAVLAYAADGVLFLDTPGYMQRYPVHHNLFWAADEGAPWLEYSVAQSESSRQTGFRVDNLTGGAVAQLVTISSEAPHMMPLHQERTVLLARGGPMVVLDRVTPFVDGLIGSPLWQAETIHRTGPDWAETSVDEFRGMNGPSMQNAKGRLLVADPLDDALWTESVHENTDAYDAPHYVEPITRYFVYWKASHVTTRCLARPRALVRGQANDFVSVLMPSPGGSEPASAIRRVGPDAGEATNLVVGNGLFVRNDGSDVASGRWGQSDAAVLWSEPGGVFAHRAREIQLAADNEREAFAFSSGEAWVDLDLEFDDRGLRGSISSYRASTVTIAVGSREHALTVRGITPVDIVR